MTVRPDAPTLAQRSTAFLDYVESWLTDRPTLDLAELIERVGGPDNVAIMSVDLIVGFCHQGALASPRVEGILPAVTRLLERAHGLGVRHIVLTQDTHVENAEEFGSFPPHCVVGTAESQTTPELMALSFADDFAIVEKNSISSTIAPQWTEWENANGPFAAWIIVGDCTDLCVYQAAMALMTRSFSEQRGQRVVIPVDCVQTYDMPVETAGQIGAEPHEGDLLHAVFLHSMALNGVEVVSRVV
jgi:nicotinamidase-related amidase